MISTGIQRLLKEVQAAQLRERRSVDRKPFVRPVEIAAGRNRSELHDAFSRDISIQGIGLISRVEWPEATMARLKIHSLDGKEVAVNAKVRWCQPYGHGWYLAGWTFLDEC